MNAPRLEINLDKLYFNAQYLVKKLSRYGISVTGVTKATLGSEKIASLMLRAGVVTIGDSRMENIESLRQNGVKEQLFLIRSPMISQVDRVVANASISFNSELDVLKKLSEASILAGCNHGIVLMVELGDLREGIMPSDLSKTVEQVLKLPNLTIRGIGTNLACQNGVSPDAENMLKLSQLACSIEKEFDIKLEIISGGNSANLNWVFSGDSIGRINNLRLGESILLGRETLSRNKIDNLNTDAFTLIAEVIESKIKPSSPTGHIAQTAFGEKSVPTDRGDIFQSILAIGRQDTDPDGLIPPENITILGTSSDHLVLESKKDSFSCGQEISFQVNYSALLRAMTSPYITKVWLNG